MKFDVEFKEVNFIDTDNYLILQENYEEVKRRLQE